jgi:Flp pilus assembly protein TadB
LVVFSLLYIVGCLFFVQNKQTNKQTKQSNKQTQQSNKIQNKQTIKQTSKTIKQTNTTIKQNPKQANNQTKSCFGFCLIVCLFWILFDCLLVLDFV